jgi:hypothetical protein
LYHRCLLLFSSFNLTTDILSFIDGSCHFDVNTKKGPSVFATVILHPSSSNAIETSFYNPSCSVSESEFLSAYLLCLYRNTLPSRGTPINVHILTDHVPLLHLIHTP